jgi:hypothetical protein
MWTCPKCKHKFYNPNQSHSCGSYTIDDFLKDKSKTAIELFHYFVSEYKKIGPVEIHPVKTRVALLTKCASAPSTKSGKIILTFTWFLQNLIPAACVSIKSTTCPAGSLSITSKFIKNQTLTEKSENI